MGIPGYRWVRGLVREQRYEQALREKGDKTWDAWLDERIAAAPQPPTTTAVRTPTSNSDVTREE